MQSKKEQIETRMNELKHELQKLELECKLLNDVLNKRVKLNETYFFIQSDGVIQSSTERFYSKDDYRFYSGNYYRTYEEAIIGNKKQCAFNIIYNYIYSNGFLFIPNWKDSSQKKFFINHYPNNTCKTIRGYFSVGITYLIKTDQRLPYFESEEICKNVIDNCVKYLDIYYSKFEYKI